MTKKSRDDFTRGTLDLIVLSVLVDGAKYGYLIQQRLGQASGGRVQVQAGTLYPLLHRLEAEKLIRSRVDQSTGRKRKWYQLTLAGKRSLKRQAVEWHDYAECLRKLLVPVFDALPDTA